MKPILVQSEFADVIHLFIVSNIIYRESILRQLQMFPYHPDLPSITSELGVYYLLLMKFYRTFPKYNEAYQTYQSIMNYEQDIES